MQGRRNTRRRDILTAARVFGRATSRGTLMAARSEPRAAVSEPMLELIPNTAGRRRPLRILCLGAHCDDIDIGCGGTLIKLLSRGEWDVTWAVMSADEVRGQELRASSRRFLRRAGRARVLTFGFKDAYFPAEYAEIKKTFESLKSAAAPDMIFTHHRADQHQDHRIVAELTWNAFRRHLILEYEIPKYEGGLTTPNAYVQLTEAQVRAKSRALVDSYPSQRAKAWFTEETFTSLMRMRGIEAGPGTGWAEGFHVSKLCLA
jgi:LmbE family N-acetylglucosaminyl deacetylase